MASLSSAESKSMLKPSCGSSGFLGTSSPLSVIVHGSGRGASMERWDSHG